jgi:glutamate/tyrosine decarboxylase-like PLP-dependent enzyme
MREEPVKLERDSLSILEEMLDMLDKGFSNLPDTKSAHDLDAMREVLLEVAERMQDNFPYFNPLYAGQMLKPPHPVARLAYMLSLWINPNNHALDGGRASSAMEKEAVAAIAGLLGWDVHLGHLTSGGTMANLEALWVAGRLKPDLTIVASEQAHYTHGRITDVIGLPFQTVPCDTQSRMDTDALERMLKRGGIGVVVATAGTTGTGAVDPLWEILELRTRYGFRLHVDAAYGGYYMLASNLRQETSTSLDCLRDADSIVIDPHKHGLQPYGCGCVLFRDPGVGRLYKHDSPYTYFSSSELHLGEISLECSRPGAAAVALWATQKLFPMKRGGEFAKDLEKCREAAMNLYIRMRDDTRFFTFLEPELDIVVWAPKASRISEMSQLSTRLFEDAASRNLHLALFTYPTRLIKNIPRSIEIDQETLTCLRSCMMKPEHLDWVHSIWQILCTLADTLQ